MACPMCGGEDRKLYHLPVTKQLGSVPIYAACFFCYLKITSNRPGAALLVGGSGSGSRS